jgi:anti-sigma factor ChrR (cupin superfamily)
MSMKREARGKRPTFYQDPALDQMMSMIMVLAGEVSVLADQLDSTHRVLAKHGIDASAEIAALVFDDAALEQREARRQAMLERMFYLVRKEAVEAGAKETTESYIKTIDEIAVG